MDRLNFLFTEFTNVSTSTQMATGDNLSATPRALVAAKTGFTVYIQKVTFSISGADKAKQLLIKDSAGTPIVIVSVNATADPSDVASTPGSRTIDFGTEGYACTADKGVDLWNSAAGPVASVALQAYRKTTPNA